MVNDRKRMAHMALKQQAQRDLLVKIRLFPTDQEVAAAPPPTPKAVARMAEIFAGFRREVEEQKAIENKRLRIPRYREVNEGAATIRKDTKN